MKTNICWTVEWFFAYVELVQGWKGPESQERNLWAQRVTQKSHTVQVKVWQGSKLRAVTLHENSRQEVFCNSGKSSGPVRPPDGHTSSGLEAAVSGWIPSPPWGSDSLSYVCLLHFSSTFLRHLSWQMKETGLSSFSSCSSLSSSFPSAAALPHCVFSPFQTLSFLPLSPSFSLCLWSLTLNLTPSICFSSFVGSALFLIKITSGFDL